MVRNRTLVFLGVRPFLSYQDQGHLSSQGQISRSLFSKKGLTGALSVFHKHGLFDPYPAYPLTCIKLSILYFKKKI